MAGENGNGQAEAEAQAQGPTGLVIQEIIEGSHGVECERRENGGLLLSILVPVGLGIFKKRSFLIGKEGRDLIVETAVGGLEIARQVPTPSDPGKPSN